MGKKQARIDGSEIAKALAEKFKNFNPAQGGGKDFPDIQNIILEVLSDHGIELPDKAKQAIQQLSSQGQS